VNVVLFQKSQELVLRLLSQVGHHSALPKGGNDAK
jgi:hypothetical protein